MATISYETEPRCGNCQKLLFGRRDKKYCNDQCRNRANSHKRKTISWDEPKHVYEITRDIKRNRTILAKFFRIEQGPKVVKRRKLLDEGFAFEFYTNILDTKKGRYHYCYEFGWMDLEEGKVLVVETDKYYKMTHIIKEYDLD